MAVYRALMLCPRFFTAKIIVYSTVVWYALSDGAFSVDRIFVLVAAYNSVRASIQLFIPLAITCLSEAQTTLSRIKVVSFRAYAGVTC